MRKGKNMNQVAEHTTKILQSLNNNGFLWPVVFIGFVITLFLFWLLLRGLRLWYWRVNVQVNTLKNIDRRLRDLGATLKEAAVSAPENVEHETTAGNDTKIEAAIQTKNDDTRKEVQSIGKTGKIYTEKELEELIKD